MKPFGQLSREAKLELMTAWVDGKQMEVNLGGDRWLEVDPMWTAESSYRVAPPLPIKATIPWEHIKPEYKWAAMDESGNWYCYKKKPEAGPRSWFCDGLSSDNASIKAVAFPEGNMPWEQSLVERP